MTQKNLWEVDVPVFKGLIWPITSDWPIILQETVYEIKINKKHKK